MVLNQFLNPVFFSEIWNFCLFIFFIFTLLNLNWGTHGTNGKVNESLEIKEPIEKKIFKVKKVNENTKNIFLTENKYFAEIKIPFTQMIKMV